jgi:hypothetical protein
MFATCRHIMPSGLRCQSPAMRGNAFCYSHGRRIPPAPNGAPTSEGRVDIPATLNGQGITHALTQVLRGLGSGGISPRRASVLFYGLQLAANRPLVQVTASDDSTLSALGDPADLSAEDAAALAEFLLQKFGPAPEIRS